MNNVLKGLTYIVSHDVHLCRRLIWLLVFIGGLRLVFQRVKFNRRIEYHYDYKENQEKSIHKNDDQQYWTILPISINHQTIRGWLSKLFIVLISLINSDFWFALLASACPVSKSHNLFELDAFEVWARKSIPWFGQSFAILLWVSILLNYLDSTNADDFFSSSFC